MIRRYLPRFLVMAVVSASLLLFFKWHVVPSGSKSLRISTEEEIIASIRHGLRGHSSCITVRFRHSDDVLDILPEAAGAWIEAALRETDDPTEGDYIRYQYGGYEMECSAEPDGDQKSYRVEIRPKYYLYLIQEEAVTAELQRVYAEFGFDQDSSDFDKAEAIYAFVCSHVQYDQVHKKNTYFHMKSTAYSALIRHTATCQGYSVLLYRMLRDNGIRCRVITGTASGETGTEYHAWNLAEVNGRYYYLDATWDAGKPRENWTCFLKGAADFPDHEPDPQFLTSSFLREYPLFSTPA